jgi:intracellular sulfur oxidation DsrE/DsrF family protein
MAKDKISTLLIVLFPILLMAQSPYPIKKSGTVVNGFGEVWELSNTDFLTNTEMTYKVIFDIYDSPENPERINSQINTIARFLNMHANAEVPLEQLKVSAVFHNKASQDILTSSHYKVKYGVINPNEPLIKLLLENGVNLYFCGQSSLSRKVPKEKVIPGIDVALSAMTVILDHTSRGYTLIKF